MEKIIFKLQDNFKAKINYRERTKCNYISIKKCWCYTNLLRRRSILMQDERRILYY